MSSRRVTERESRGVSRRQRFQEKTGRAEHYPNRGQKNAYGETFQGFDSLKLAAQILSDEALHHKQNRPGYLDGFGLPGEIYSLPNVVILTRENLVGEVVQGGNIVNVPGSKVTGQVARGNLDLPDVNAMPGRYRSANLDWQDESIPKRAISGVDWGQVDNKPSIVTPADTQRFLTKKEADKLYKRK